mgnify:CR=1 FL=1|tara:strand:- start:1124 stop:2116 length:993 start_codon:yes stop_codon:yes gene_type:complete
MKDYRLKENRLKFFTGLYEMNLRYGVMPGLVYLYLPELADRFGWCPEQKLWFAFLNGMTQNPITSLAIYEKIPEPPSETQLQKFGEWFDDQWDNLQFDTDRRYQKKDTVDSIRSYTSLLSHFKSQEEMLTGSYRSLWNRVSKRYKSFGRLSSFSYLEYVYLYGFGADCANLLFEDKSGSKSHRNGMLLLQGHDEWVWDKRMENGFDGKYPQFDKMCRHLRSSAESFLEEFRLSHPNVNYVGNFTFESNLCTFKNHFFGRRYPGVYADMAWDRIEWAESRGRDCAIFKDMRSELLPEWLRAECAKEKIEVRKQGLSFRDNGLPFRGEWFLK